MSHRLNHPSTLVSHWLLQGDGSDSCGRYPGTPANMTGWPASGPFGRKTVAELNGTSSNINLGDIAELNEVSAFTLAFWMNQDVLDQIDLLFDKSVNANNHLQFYTHTDGNLYLRVRNGAATHGVFDYSTVISGGTWVHLAIVFDGTQATDADRLVCYVNGAPVTLTFTGPIPATTADMSGEDAFIGRATSGFDGRLWDMRLYSVPLSRQEINQGIIHSPIAYLV